MHDIEIVLQDDITASVVIKELEGGSNSVGNVNDALIEDSKNEMNSKGQPSVQQAAAITKAPLIAAANKAKNGLNNTLARINSGKSLLLLNRLKRVVIVLHIDHAYHLCIV